MSARIAGFAILAAEATAVATRTHGLATLVVWTVLVALQIVAVVWATDSRSAVVLRMVAPAGLTAVTVAAAWTALALAVPTIATGNAVALVAIVAVGLVVATSSRRGAGQRLLPLALIASAGSALLIFLAISWVLPTIPGYVSHNHPPTYTDVTRLVDPIGEFAIFVVLALALGVEVLRARTRIRRTAAARAASRVRRRHRTRWSSSPTSRHSRSGSWRPLWASCGACPPVPERAAPVMVAHPMRSAVEASIVHT